MAVTVNSYRVTARRSGDWWALDVPELPGVHSQTKRLDQAGKEIREAIALMLDIEEDEFDLTIEPSLGYDEQRVLRELEVARFDAEAANVRLRNATQQAVLELTRTLSQRDVGALLGVSFQRVHQIKDEAETAAALRQMGFSADEATRASA